ncbi:MAG: hypothetical protein H6740_04335 [Alphaproteobacteria bacterium]|nr:hypothetical protein [Alphaproteobacteria bacterium]
MLLIALLATSVAQAPAFEVEFTAPSVYLGRGAETGIQGLDPDAEVYREEIRARFQLDNYGLSGDTATLSGEVQRLFEGVARDYRYFGHISPLIREAWGYRSGDDKAQISPMAFIAELSKQQRQGRDLLTDRRIRELVVDLADNYAVREGALKGCAGEVRAWLTGLVDEAPKSKDPSALREALLKTDGGAIRARMQSHDGSGCERSGPRDFLYLSYGGSYGINVGSEGSWFVIEYDYSDRAPGKLERVFPYEKIGGPSRYFRGQYKLVLDPAGETVTVVGGYDIDLSLWPERVVTQAHEQFLSDFTYVLYERWAAASQGKGE